MLYSGKVVVFLQKWLFSCEGACIRTKWLYSGKSGCNRSKVVVLVQKWLYSGKMDVFGQK